MRSNSMGPNIPQAKKAKKVKEPTLLFKKSRGRRPRWCGQPLRVVGLGRDGTLHGTYESCSCLFPLGRPVSRKACKKKT